MIPGALRVGAHVVASRGAGGGTRLDRLRCSPPLALRQAGGSLWMVGTAAGPLPGDRVELHLEVGEGAVLTLRSTAASVALPGSAEGPSELLVEADVGAGARLRWLPEPTVAAAGCHHRSVARIRLGAGAGLVWRDELVLGRHGEGPGRLVSRGEVEGDGRPLLRQEHRLGPGVPGWDGPAVTAGARALGIIVAVDPGNGARAPASPGPPLGRDVAVMALAGGGGVVSALAADAPGLRRRLEAGQAVLEGPGADGAGGREGCDW